jgi:hypothetical protein
MSGWRKNSKELKLKMDLVKRFETGEKITLREAVEDYLHPATLYRYLISEKLMKSLFHSIKADYMKEGQPFGALSENNEHGIPNTKAEYEFMGIGRYKLVKGVIRGSGIIVGSGVRLGLIRGETRRENIALPTLDENGNQLTAKQN